MKLVKMTEADYELVKGKMIRDYASDKINVGHWQEEDAISLAKETLENILSNGVDTKDHYLYLASEDNKTIGFLWFNLFKEVIYVNNLTIYDEFESKGYEVDLISLIDSEALELGGRQINLHAFGYNEKALKTYEDMGYKITDIYMKKGV